MKKIFDTNMTTKQKVLAIVGAVFALAATLGSTILSPEQRELILSFLGITL